MGVRSIPEKKNPVNNKWTLVQPKSDDASKVWRGCNHLQKCSEHFEGTFRDISRRVDCTVIVTELCSGSNNKGDFFEKIDKAANKFIQWLESELVSNLRFLSLNKCNSRFWIRLCDRRVDLWGGVECYYVTDLHGFRWGRALLRFPSSSVLQNSKGSW